MLPGVLVEQVMLRESGASPKVAAQMAHRHEEAKHREVLVGKPTSE